MSYSRFKEIYPLLWEALDTEYKGLIRKRGEVDREKRSRKNFETHKKQQQNKKNKNKTKPKENKIDQQKNTKLENMYLRIRTLRRRGHQAVLFIKLNFTIEIC